MRRKTLSLVVAALAILALATSPVAAKPPTAQSGTTLAAYKTIDICSVDVNTWRFSGEIAVWNEGAVDTSGLAIQDCIQNKVDAGQFVDTYCDASFDPALHEILAGTTMETATTFKYTIEAAPLEGYIRNSAYLTILNHSGSLGTPKGPNPKATYTGPMPPPECSQECGGCTYTQGYWKNHEDAWPMDFSPTAVFFSATKQVCIENCGGNPNDDVFETQPATWADVLDTPVNVSQGYYQLAHQYIAAVLNQASGACVPDGIQDTLEFGYDWLSAHAPSACTGASSCGTQKDWAAVLDDYNNGVYQDGPPHCSDEVVP
jgi:hypothetical protein